MKNRWILPALTLCFLLFLTACGGPAPADSDSVTINNIETGTFHNGKTGIELTLGMTRDEVEDLLPVLGAHMSAEYPVMYGNTAGEMIGVRYDGETDTIVEIQLDKPENADTQWSLAGGITIGSPLEKILEVYGPASEQDQEQTFLLYFYDADGRLMKEETGKTAYSVTFIVTEQGLESCCVMSR